MFAGSCFYLVPSQPSHQALALLGQRLLPGPLKEETIPRLWAGAVGAGTCGAKPARAGSTARSDEGHESSGHRTELQLP